MLTDSAQDRDLTIGELCQAIAAGDVPYTKDHDSYVVTHREARALLHRQRRSGHTAHRHAYGGTLFPIPPLSDVPPTDYLFS